MQSFMLRRADAKQRPALKEKFVDIFESFFQVLLHPPPSSKSVADFINFEKGNNPAQDNPYFWDELFLLKVNAPFLDACIKEASEEQCLALKVKKWSMLN